MGPIFVLDGCEKSCPTGIRSPERPARCESYKVKYICVTAGFRRGDMCVPLEFYEVQNGSFLPSS
jgi:hypothetical protein